LYEMSCRLQFCILDDERQDEVRLFRAQIDILIRIGKLLFLQTICRVQFYRDSAMKILLREAEREEMQGGTAANPNQSVDAEVHSEFDRSQGHPVAQKEDARHFTNQDDAL